MNSSMARAACESTLSFTLRLLQADNTSTEAPCAEISAMMPVILAGFLVAITIAVFLACAAPLGDTQKKGAVVARAVLDVDDEGVRFLIANVNRADGAIVGEPMFNYDKVLTCLEADGSLVAGGVPFINLTVALLGQMAVHGARELASFADSAILATDLQSNVAELTRERVQLKKRPDENSLVVTKELKEKYGKCYRCASLMKHAEYFQPLPR